MQVGICTHFRQEKARTKETKFLVGKARRQVGRRSNRDKAWDMKLWTLRSGRWKDSVPRALGSHSGAGSQGGEVPILEPSREGEMQPRQGEDRDREIGGQAQDDFEVSG